MTHRTDVARGRDIVARWCALAEQRLEYLTELFETGRWRRFHSELEFLENIQEAKTAVETWRDLLTREASLDNSAIDISWLGRRARRCRRSSGFPPAASAPQSPQPRRGCRATAPPPMAMSWSRRRASPPIRPKTPVRAAAPAVDEMPLPTRWISQRCRALSAAAQRAVNDYR